MNWIREFLSYAAIILFVIIIRSYIITPVRVNGLSMYPNLTEGQVLLLEKVDKKYKRFDIVVITYEEDKKKKKIIKRIIGLPGEHISYKNNTLYVNNQKDITVCIGYLRNICGFLFSDAECLTN